MEYYLGEGSRQHGPYTVDQLRAMHLRPDTLAWREGMAQWQPIGQIPELKVLFSAPPPPPSATVPGPLPCSPPGTHNVDDSKRIVAGVIALIPGLGTLGIHKFILGYTSAGLVYLLVTLCTCGAGAVVMHVLAVVEGIIYLCKSDEEFHSEYVVGRKPWF